jgi:hypothetical protein
MLADMARTDARWLHPAAGDSPEAEGVKVLARAHNMLIRERSRQVERLRHHLRGYFPTALEAMEDLDAPGVLELLSKAPERPGPRGLPGHRWPPCSSTPGAATSPSETPLSWPRCAASSSVSLPF